MVTPISLSGVCGRDNIDGWSSMLVFPASLSTDGPGHTWAKTGGPLPWGPMQPKDAGAGRGTPNADAYALTVVVLATAEETQ